MVNNINMRQLIILLLICTLLACTKESDEDIVITQPPLTPIEQTIKNTTWQCLGKWSKSLQSPNNRTTYFFDSTFEYHDSLSMPERFEFFVTSRYYKYSITNSKITMLNINVTSVLLKIDTVRQMSTIYEYPSPLELIITDTIFIRNDSLYIGNKDWNWGIKLK